MLVLRSITLEEVNHTGRDQAGQSKIYQKQTPKDLKYRQTDDTLRPLYISRQVLTLYQLLDSRRESSSFESVEAASRDNGNLADQLIRSRDVTFLSRSFVRLPTRRDSERPSYTTLIVSNYLFQSSRSLKVGSKKTKTHWFHPGLTSSPLGSIKQTPTAQNAPRCLAQALP